jgi:hypothetical protein
MALSLIPPRLVLVIDCTSLHAGQLSVLCAALSHVSELAQVALLCARQHSALFRLRLIKCA